MDHGGVRAGGAVSAAELAEGELGLIHHGRDVELGAAHAAEEIEPSEFVRGGGGGRGTGRDGACVASGASAPVVPTGASVAMARAGVSGRAREGAVAVRRRTTRLAARIKKPAGSRVRRGGVCPSARPTGAVAPRAAAASAVTRRRSRTDCANPDFLGPIDDDDPRGSAPLEFFSTFPHVRNTFALNCPPRRAAAP